MRNNLFSHSNPSSNLQSDSSNLQDDFQNSIQKMNDLIIPKISLNSQINQTKIQFSTPSINISELLLNDELSNLSNTISPKVYQINVKVPKEQRDLFQKLSQTGCPIVSLNVQNESTKSQSPLIVSQLKLEVANGQNEKFSKTLNSHQIKINSPNEQTVVLSKLPSSRTLQFSFNYSNKRNNGILKSSALKFPQLTLKAPKEQTVVLSKLFPSKLPQLTLKLSNENTKISLRNKILKHNSQNLPLLLNFVSDSVNEENDYSLMDRFPLVFSNILKF